MFKRLLSICFACVMIGFSTISGAQVEAVNPQLINQYGLDLSNPQPNTAPYSLVTGSDELIAQGYNMAKGALYLIDNSNNSIELISKTLSGQPALLSPQFTIGYGYFDASLNFEKIAYTSNNPDIVSNDSGTSIDVFIYDRSTGLTSRVEGNHPHQGFVFGLRISPMGDTVAFTSSDFDFGDSSSITGPLIHFQRLIYTYNLISNDLSAVSFHVMSGGGSDLSLLGRNSVSYSLDGTQLFFQEEFFDGHTTTYEIFVNDLQTNTTTSLQGTKVYDGNIGPLEAINNTHYIVYKRFYDTSFFQTISHNPIIINLPDNEVVPLPDDGQWSRYGGTSDNQRYALFYTSRYVPQQYDSGTPVYNTVDSTAGTIWVIDTQTGESREAFTVSRNALNYIGGDGGGYPICEFIYIDTPPYRQQIGQSFPCTDPAYYSGTVDDYIQSSFDTYNIDPGDLRLHNDDRYITFDANAWYLDESIAYGDFSIPYARDTFVVANPFLTGINLQGRPAVDRSSESGVYIWRNSDGRTLLQAVAGDTAQNDQNTNFKGSITSPATLGSLTPISIESSDALEQPALNRVDFDLWTKRPWEDRFSFIADASQSLCVNLTEYAGGLFLGPNKIEVAPPFDLNGFDGCASEPDIETLGKPTFDRSTDTGIFLWENQTNNWVAHVVSGDQQRMVELDITSTQAISNVQQVSIETSDVFTILPMKLDMSLNVLAPWLDGAKFTVQGQADTCVLTSNVDVPIFVGPNRINVGSSFDFKTQTACAIAPDIETLGKPVFDRSVDTGIFIWENQPNNWAAHVVSGDQQRIVEVDVDSSGSISNVQKVSIESSDVFTQLPNALDMSLNVTTPWLDGFKFTDQSQATTCVSTSNADVPIYVGPDRVNVGMSIDLETLTICQ